MKAEPLRLAAERPIQPLMIPEKSISKPTDSSLERTADTRPSAAVEAAAPLEERGSDTAYPPQQPPVNTETSSNSSSKPMPAKSASTAKPATATKPVTLPKPAADKPSAPPPSIEPQPSLPVSMIVRPDSPASVSGSSLFPGELEESFESALAKVELAPARGSIASRILRGMCRLIWSDVSERPEPLRVQRMVAFDGFRSDLFDDKRERDRRYGTVYTVSEEANAFLVRLELPRRMPNSSLKQTWELPDEMPDYAYTLSLADNVLCIGAGLPDEARRRLSYISSSFPSDFQTRIEFHTPVEGYKHRLRNKVLEIIVYKKPDISPARKSRRPPLQD
jgi:hypothetical protein